MKIFRYEKPQTLRFFLANNFRLEFSIEEMMGKKLRLLSISEN